MSVGLTPGFLSKGFNLHVLCGSIYSGFSSLMAKLLAVYFFF